MRILLVNPPFYRFIGLEQDYVPLSLLAVGSQLSVEGHEVYFKNLEIGKDLNYVGYKDRFTNFNKYIESLTNDNEVWNELIQTIKEIAPDKIGINVLSVKYKSALKIIEIADKFNIPCFVGGPRIMTYDNIFPNNVEVIRGEFESRNTGKRIKDLDLLPFSNFDILLDKYSPNGYSHIVSSRGCPFQCRFCASNTIWDRKVTFKSAKRIISEMKIIKEKFGSTLFTFWDETFTLKEDRFLEFCDLYDVDAQWICDTRADVLTDNIVKNMKKSKCKHVSLGIESGKQHILNYIKKGETLEDFVKASELLNKYNIQWKTYCIIGFPEETEQDIFESLEFIKKLNPFRITLSFFTPYKKTELYDECVEKGLITETYDPSMFAHQSPNNYFCHKIPKERYEIIKDIVTKDIDSYNKESLKYWK